MIYSDEELKRWWDTLSKYRRNEIFENMIDRAYSDSFREFAESLKNQENAGKKLSLKQLAQIKKWDR